MWVCLSSSLLLSPISATLSLRPVSNGRPLNMKRLLHISSVYSRRTKNHRQEGKKVVNCFSDNFLICKSLLNREQRDVRSSAFDVSVVARAPTRFMLIANKFFLAEAMSQIVSGWHTCSRTKGVIQVTASLSRTSSWVVPFDNEHFCVLSPSIYFYVCASDARFFYCCFVLFFGDCKKTFSVNPWLRWAWHNKLQFSLSWRIRLPRTAIRIRSISSDAAAVCDFD